MHKNTDKEQNEDDSKLSPKINNAFQNHFTNIKNKKAIDLLLTIFTICIVCLTILLTFEICENNFYIIKYVHLYLIFTVVMVITAAIIIKSNK